MLVAMGQTITPSRISDFVKAYSPEPVAASADATGATLAAVEQEMGGTGAAPALVKQGRTPAKRTEPGTMLMDQPVRSQPPGSRGLLYGVAAFLGIAIIGGVGGYFVLFRAEEAPPRARVPVVVERATTVVDTRPPETAPPPKDEPRVAEPAPKNEPPREEPHKKPPKRVAAVETPSSEPTPVVVVREPPKAAEPPQPRPTVTAKGELELRIRPWAKVEVDGREIGVTPLDAPLMLSAGDHQVRLINPDLGKDITRTVHINASEKEVLKEILDE
jgi:hypothetical protein